MPKIPTYTAGKLASEQVGVPSADQSGVIVGQAVANLGAKIFEIGLEQKQKQDALDTSLAKSQYSVDMAHRESDILSTPGLKSEDVERRYLEESQKVRENILARYPDGGTRQKIDQELQLEQNQYQVRAIGQRLKLKGAEELNDVFTTLEGVVQAPFDPTAYNKQVGELKDIKQKLIDRGYDVLSASRLIDNSLDNKAQYAIDDAIDNGREAEIYTAFNSGVFDSITGKKKAQLGQQINEALATREYRAGLKTQAKVLAQSVEMAGQFGSLDIKGMTHQLSQFEFELDEGIRNKSLSPEQVTTLTKNINYLEAMRKSKLNMAYVGAYDDPNKKAEILSKIATTIKNTGRSAVRQPGVTMDELLEVRDDLLKAFVDEGRISRRTFEEYNSSVLAAVSKGFIEGVFAGKAQDLWRGPAGVRKGFESDDQKNVMELFKAAKRVNGEYDPITMQAIFDEYLTDKRQTQAPLTITPELARDYARRGWLSRNGYGTDFKVGDTIQMKNGNWKISSVGDLGVPTFEVPDEVLQKINQIKLEKSNAGSNR